MPLLLLLILVVWGLGFGNALAGELKIGVIDLQKVVRSSEAGQEAAAKLQTKFETLKKQLEAKRKEIEAFKAELEKKAPLLSEEARTEKRREYQKMIQEFRAQQEDAQYEMREAEKKALQPILQELEEVLRKMAQKEGYHLIIEKNMPGIYWISPKLEITQQVIELYDRYRAAKKQK